MFPLLYPLLLPKGISFPLLFSTVAIPSQVLRTQPEVKLASKNPALLSTSGVWGGAETLSLGHRQFFIPVPDDSTLTSSFFVSTDRKIFFEKLLFG